MKTEFTDERAENQANLENYVERKVFLCLEIIHEHRGNGSELNQLYVNYLQWRSKFNAYLNSDEMKEEGIVNFLFDQKYLNLDSLLRLKLAKKTGRTLN
jgi:hypothetical protein